MNKLTLALATTAVAAATCASFVSTAEAGRRGGHGLRMHFHTLNALHARRAYHDDEEGYYLRRKRKVVVKQVVKYVEKPAAKPAAVVAKYVDGQGRQFDLASKVWFDGKSQCWQGDNAFVFKSGSWFYGDARWIESSAGWGVSSGEVPQQVSCDGIKAFSAKIEQAQAKPAKSVVEPKVEKIEKAEVKPVEKPAKVVTSSTETAAKTSDCKKYFPSVGEMVSVPCTE